MKWCPSATSIYLSVSSNEPGIKPKICGVIWHIAPESKIQLVNCKLSPKYLLELLSLSDIRSINAYIFWSLLLSPLLHYFCDAWLHLSLKRICFCHFSLYLGGFGNLAIRGSSDPHLKHLRGVHSVRLLSETPATRSFSFSFLILLVFKYIMIGTSKIISLCLDKIWSLAIFTTTWTAVKI